MNSKKKVNEKDNKKQFKMISTTAPTTISNPNMTQSINQLYYVNESDDLAYNEKRSAHNALERQRREGLNSKFQELAHVLPSLKQVTRPSKSLIVAKSLEFVSKAEERENDFQTQIQALKRENEQLMRQAHLSKKQRKKRKSSLPKGNSSSKVPTTTMHAPIITQANVPTNHTIPISQHSTMEASQPMKVNAPLMDPPPLKEQLAPNYKKKRGRDDDTTDRPTKKQQTPSIPSHINQPDTNNLDDQLLLSTQYNMDTNYMYVNFIPATNTPISHNHSSSTTTNLLDSFLNDNDLFQWH